MNEISLSLDLINVKDGNNFYVDVSKNVIVCPCLSLLKLQTLLFYFFPKSALPDWGCGLSKGAAYTRTFTVYPEFIMQSISAIRY